MSDDVDTYDEDNDPGADVLVFRHPGTNAPVPVPESLALECHRPFRAWQRRRAGEGWDVIAQVESYADAQAAAYDVAAWLRAAKTLYEDWTRQELLSIEVARLDALQSAVWNKAMSGHAPSIKIVQDCIAMRVKYRRLDEPQEGEEDDVAGRTVIITEADYSGGLKKAIEHG